MKKRLAVWLCCFLAALIIAPSVSAQRTDVSKLIYSHGYLGYVEINIDTAAADDMKTAQVIIFGDEDEKIDLSNFDPATLSLEAVCDGKRIQGTRFSPGFDPKSEFPIVYSLLICKNDLQAVRLTITNPKTGIELPYNLYGKFHAASNETPENPFAKFAGDWKGRVPEMNIELEFTINEDGTGSYRFTQNDYSETYDATLEAGDKTFKVDLPEKNALNLTGCEGTYRYADGTLTLDVTTTFASGRKFDYTIDCERVETMDEAKSGAESDGCANVMGVRNIDQKNNVFDFIDLDTNEKIRYEKLFADGKEIQAFSALNEKKPMVLLFFDKSELEFNSDGSLKQFSILNVSLQWGDDEICYSLEDGVLTILGKRE